MTSDPTPTEVVPAPDPGEAPLTEPLPTDVSVVVPASGAPAPTRRKRDRVLGTTGQVLGVVGMILSIVLIVGVIFARSWAIGTVDDLATTVDGQIAKAQPVIAQVQSTVGEVSGRVSTVADIATGIANDPAPGGALADTLRSAISGINDKYQALRQAYADIREKVVSLMDVVNSLNRFIPGLAIPQGATDALNSFDTKIQAFDSQVNSVLNIDPGNGPANKAAAAIADAANGLDAKLQTVQDGLTEVDQRVAQLRTDVADTARTVDLGITIATIVIILLLLWILVLHWVLFRHSGEIRRKTTAG